MKILMVVEDRKEYLSPDFRLRIFNENFFFFFFLYLYKSYNLNVTSVTR